MVSSISSMLGGSGNSLAAMRQAMFQKTDTDSNGSLSLEEFKASGPSDGKKPDGAPSVEDIFSQIDTNGDGNLTTSELDANAEANFKNQLSQGGNLSLANILQANETDSHAQDFLSAADTDGDGGLSLKEFDAAKPKDGPSDVSSEDIFNQLDSNGDGSLTLSELETSQQQAGAGGSPPGGPPAGGAPPSGGSQGSSSSADSSSDDTEYDSLDTNKDGVVSASEKAAGNVNALLGQMLNTLLSAQEDKFSFA